MIGTRPGAPLAGLPAGFWTALAVASHRLLMLDYDGTLVPFHDRPDEARPNRRILSLFERIVSAPNTTLAIVSGRPLSDLEGLLGRLPVILVGEHGWDVRRPDGRVERHAIPAACAAALERAAEIGKATTHAGTVERKRASIVLHTRGLPHDQAHALIRSIGGAWGAGAAHSGLRLDTINGGLELRAAQRDKGMVVRELMAASPSGSVPVYLGDDVTDEDAFRAVRAAGYGIRVGPDERVSGAMGRLESFDDVGRFLERWLESAEHLARA